VSYKGMDAHERAERIPFPSLHKVSSSGRVTKPQSDFEKLRLKNIADNKAVVSKFL